MRVEHTQVQVFCMEKTVVTKSAAKQSRRVIMLVAALKTYFITFFVGGIFYNIFWCIGEHLGGGYYVVTGQEPCPVLWDSLTIQKGIRITYISCRRLLWECYWVWFRTGWELTAGFRE